MMTSAAAHINVPKKKKRKSKDTLTPKQFVQRQRLINNVLVAWIKGVLEPVRADEGWHQLTAEIVLPNMDVEKVVLDSGDQITEVFQQAGRTLVILGPPGAGKTITLLTLAEELLMQARSNPALPIPVVIQLASWAKKRPENLDEWLIERVRLDYGVKNKLAKQWLNEGALLLLLDGLDEVPAEDRDACISAINAFSKAGHATSNNGIVVSSRLDAFDDLTERLPAAGEVRLQPLTSEQVTDYLLALGDDGTDLYDAMLSDPVLSELAQSPLMLSFMANAYRDEPYDQITGFASAADQRQHLFDQYIARCMSEAAAHPAYDHHQTRRYLTWLATKMIQHRQSVFHIERLRPDWLDTPQQRRRYGRITWEFLGLRLVLLFALFFGLENFNPVNMPIFALCLGQFLVMLVFLGLVSELFFNFDRFRVVDKVTWSWTEIRSKSGLRQVLALCLVLVLVCGRYQGLHSSLFLGVLLLINEGIKIEPVVTPTSPNRCIRDALENGLVLGLGVGLLFVLGFALSFGLSLGLSILLFAGLQAAVQHVVLRQLLHRAGNIPRNYADFLQYASSLHFLRQIGGGFIFRHRLLMEHFADNDQSNRNFRGGGNQATTDTEARLMN